MKMKKYEEIVAEAEFCYLFFHEKLKFQISI